MSQPIIVSANGAGIPALGLGTWRAEGEGATRAVVDALRVGYRHIDTAAMYGNEAAVGEGLKAGGVPRDDIFVTTKVWWERCLDGDLQRSAEESLRKLGLDAVDLLLIHWPNAAIPLDSSIRGLCDARRRGLARHIGVSNFPVAMLEQAVGLASEPLVANQCEYHPHLDQTTLRAACARHGIAFVSYAPLGRQQATQDATVKAVAAAHGRTPAQVLLRWHVQQPGTVAIPKSADPGRIAENFAIWDFALSPAEMAAISALARPGGRVVDPVFAPAWDV
jgi:diketogulonate reductase-like aldo/keto reductase